MLFTSYYYYFEPMEVDFCLHHFEKREGKLGVFDIIIVNSAFAEKVIIVVLEMYHFYFYLPILIFIRQS